VVEEPVKDRRRQHLVVEDLPPVHEALVGGDDRRRLLVPAGQKPEEEPRLLPVHGEIPHLVDDEDLRGDELDELPLHPVPHPRPR